MGYGGETIAKVLSHQIVEALVLAGFTQDDILQGAIEHTDLPWQVPPLVVEAPLFGVPFSDYIDNTVYVNTEALVTMWSDALAGMKNQPDKVLTFEGFRAASAAMPNVKLLDRPLYLSLPEGFPNGITDLAAVMLSLECAHVMRANSKLEAFVSNENNYYAVTSLGIDVGVRNGLPTMYADIWDVPVEGMVQEMLRSPRGSVFDGCDYNIIAKVRSVVHTHQAKIRDYEAVDWAIQALRVVDGHRELLEAVHSVKKVAHNRKLRSSALAQALQLVNQLSLTDRQLIETLKHLLVPEVISAGTFSKTIYPFNKLPPPVLAAKVSDRIKTAVEELFQQEEALYSGPRRD